MDLSELAFADTSLIIDLVMVARRLRLRGLGMRLRSPQPHIRRLIELVGLSELPSVRFEGGPASAAA